MKKYRIIGNTSYHFFDIGAEVRDCSDSEKWDLVESFGPAGNGCKWITSDGTRKNSWIVKNADLEELPDEDGGRA